MAVGSKFTPPDDAPEQRHSVRVNGAEQPGSGGSLVGKRVLICEDEAITQIQLRMILAREGLTVVGQTTNAEAAVKIALEERPDLVLMDITMPSGMDGIQAARQILSQCQTCIVILTANMGFEEEAELIGTSGYIVKPVDSTSIMPQLTAAYENFARRTAPRE